MFKKLLTLAAAALMGLGSVNAQGWTASEVGEGNFYLYNVGAQAYLTNGACWGTHSALNSEGFVVNIASVSDGVYTIGTNSKYSGKFFTANGYVDTPNSTTWTFEAVEGKTNTYKLKSQDGTYAYATNGKYNIMLGDDADADANYWQLVTADNRANYSVASVDNPLNVSFLVKNANFDQNLSDWSGSASRGGRTTGESGGGKEYTWNDHNPCVERYCNTTNFYQTLSSVPDGKYKVRCQGFYRRQSGEALSYLYANDKQVELNRIEFGGINNMSGASDAFTAGDYWNEVEVVVSGGKLTIGIKCDANTNWTIWDNFQVWYLGPVNDISVFKTSLESAVASAEALDVSGIPAVYGDNLQSVLAQYNKSYSTIEEYQAAITAINAAIDNVNAALLAGPILPKMKAETENTNVYTTEGYETYYGQWKAKYDAGTLTLAEAQALQDPTVVTGWQHEASTTIDDLLLSAWDTKNYEGAYYINTWSVEGNNDGTNFRVPFFEYWTGDDNSLGIRVLTATMTGVEPGSYVVSAWVRVRVKNGKNATDAYGITFSANDGEVDVTNGTTGISGQPQFNIGEYQAFATVGSDGILTIKFNVAEDNNISWLAFKNVKFEKTNLPALYAEINSLVATAEGLVDKDQDETVKANLTAAINNGKAASSVTDPAVLGNIIADLNSAIAASEASIAAYEKAAKEAARKAKWATIEGGVYYFKNISTGRYLGPANNWGTQASLIQHGSPITVAALENGTYTLESRVSNGGSSYYLNGNWMDGAANDIEIIKEGDDYMFYSVASAAYYSAPAEGTVLALDADYTDASKWQIISEADMIASLAAATESNPVDATFLVKRYDLGRNNRDAAAWAITDGTGNTNPTTSGTVASNNANFLSESYGNSFDMSQTLIDIPNGLYEVKATAFYRNDADEEDTNLPVVYAISGINEGTATFKQIEDGSSVNSMALAAASFAEGNYLTDGAKVLVTNGKLQIGARKEVKNTKFWSIWDNFQLSYLRPATEAEIAEGECDNILAEMLDVSKNTTVPTANVGTEPFQYNAAAVAAVQALVTEYGDYTPAQAKMALKLKGWYTKATMTEKLAEGKALVAAMQVLNAPKANTRYNIKPATEGHAKLGNAVVAKLGTVTANNPTGYAFNASDAPADYLAQAFIFTSANDATQPNAYYISIVLPEGEVYLTNGTQNGSAAGWKDSQIQGTTDAEKKLAFIIKATDKDNVFNIVNPATNSTIDCQDGGSLYTENKGKADFSVAEASKANVAIAIDEAVKYATCIFPFVPELPAAVKAYTCAVVDGTTLTLEEVTTPEANKPYILEATAGCTANLANYGTANTTSYEAGLLTGVYTETVAPEGVYVLQNLDNGVAFYQVEGEGAVTVPAGKAYLKLEEESEVKAIFFPGDEATAISGIASLTSAGVKGIYNAAGAKVNSLQKGVNIVKTADGKTLKVYVK